MYLIFSVACITFVTITFVMLNITFMSLTDGISHLLCLSFGQYLKIMTDVFKNVSIILYTTSNKLMHFDSFIVKL